MLPAVPGLWRGWKLFPAYNPEAVESDIHRLQSMYLAKGYFDANVRLAETVIHSRSAHVSFDVGYESASQFSREYRRMFGAPPGRDAAQARRVLATSNSEL